MPGLNDLLMFRIESLASEMQPNISLTMKLELKSAILQVEHMLSTFANNLVRAEINSTFLHRMRSRINEEIDLALNYNNLILIVKNYPTSFAGIRNKLSETIHEFYSHDIFASWEKSVLSFDKGPEEVECLSNELRDRVLNTKLPVEEISKSFENVNEVYLFNTLNAIVAQINENIINIASSSLYHLIASEKYFSKSQIEHNIHLKALFAFYEIEGALRRHTENDLTQDRVIIEILTHYLTQFIMLVTNQIEIAGFTKEFEAKCRQDCALIIPTLIAANSTQSTPYTSPQMQPTSREDLQTKLRAEGKLTL